jgi:hypothetical protein
MKIIRIIITLKLVIIVTLTAQQMPDTSFLPEIEKPSYSGSDAPVVAIDEAHNNFHTMNDRYLTFAEALRRDGYIVRAGIEEFSRSWLDSIDILVISNALNSRNLEDWSLPTPSAFSCAEIDAIKEWVEEGGGSLFLIADHMPFPGASHGLAEAFGFEFYNGYAGDTVRGGPAVFRRSVGMLKAHQITDGYVENERIDSLATFTGQAFRTSADCEPILVFDSNYVMLMPMVGNEFNEKTPAFPVDGWLQGAVAEVGEGRVAIFGEAAMFTAQIARSGNDEYKFGMCRPEASQNLQFLLNLMRWLSRWEKTD